MQRKQKVQYSFTLLQKGKGYKPAESDVIGTWHGTGPYKIESGDFVKPKELHQHGVLSLVKQYLS